MDQGPWMNWKTGMLTGTYIRLATKTLGELRPIFHDQETATGMPDETEVYRVQIYAPVSDGTEGGLYWGNTVIQPGSVGDEYYMTKGHFHNIRNRAEYYATIHGHGMLLLMNEARTTRIEEMSAGSVHYIPGNTAHRVANIGSLPLVFAACWPSDAGYDYETIERRGFSARMLERGGIPALVPAD
jgi:glucose-6-phosphate isomerase